ncbi:hypothetical protein ALP94_03831 [Pseudomonas savastanoi pv. glycinea]|nr:hypothetical protein ALP94_03831 [Pseudomonas savastanoi pv. glycinea]
MSDDNNIIIGSIGDANHISIAQSQATERGPICFEIVPDSVQHLSRASVKRGALYFAGSLPALMLAGMSIVADAMGIFSYLNLGWKILGWTIFAVAMVGFVFYRTIGKIALQRIPEGQAHFIDGQWVERDETGDYLLYRKTASCNYQGCKGTVRIETPPPREQHNHDYIGVCDIGGKQHTYRVDFNGIGQRQHFNWDPIDPPKQQ